MDSFPLFSSLPRDIRSNHFLIDLPIKDLLCLGSTNHEYAQIIKNPKLWRDRIQKEFKVSYTGMYPRSLYEMLVRDVSAKKIVSLANDCDVTLRELDRHFGPGQLSQLSENNMLSHLIARFIKGNLKIDMEYFMQGDFEDTILTIYIKTQLDGRRLVKKLALVNIPFTPDLITLIGDVITSPLPVPWSHLGAGLQFRQEENIVWDFFRSRFPTLQRKKGSHVSYDLERDQTMIHFICEETRILGSKTVTGYWIFD